jgi:hypothetical protein
VIEIVTTDILNKTDDFWLHRYFPAKDLNYYIDKESLNLWFSRIDTFYDNLEGWDLSNPALKLVMDLFNNYYYRVRRSGGIIIDPVHTFKLYHFLNSDINSSMPEIDIKQSINELAAFDKIRKESFISCWFATEKLEEENRAMWDLYANKHSRCLNLLDETDFSNEFGVRISVKWQDLKFYLSKTDENIKAGFINYCLNEYIEPLMFTKEISYKHECEFRLLLTRQIDEKRQCLKINNFPQIVCTIWNKKDKQSSQFLLNNGFTAMDMESESNRTFGFTNLILEIPQIDWEESLKILTSNEIK